MEKENAYVWSFDEDCFNSEEFPDIESCLANAKADKDGGKAMVYVGRVSREPYCPRIEATDLLERLEETALENYGIEWVSYNYRSQRSYLPELEDSLNKVLHDWLKKHGTYPTERVVENVTEYEAE